MDLEKYKEETLSRIEKIRTEDITDVRKSMNIRSSIDKK